MGRRPFLTTLLEELVIATPSVPELRRVDDLEIVVGFDFPDPDDEMSLTVVLGGLDPGVPVSEDELAGIAVRTIACPITHYTASTYSARR